MPYDYNSYINPNSASPYSGYDLQNANNGIQSVNPLSIIGGGVGAGSGGVTGKQDFLSQLLSNVSGGASPSKSDFGLSGLGASGNYLAPIGGIAGGIDVLQNAEDNSYGQDILGGAGAGAAIGSYFGPVGTAVGAGIGGLAGGAAKLFGGHKPGAQKERDRFRDDLKTSGFLGNDWSAKLADGSKYNFGDDGKHRTAKGALTSQIDTNDPFASQADNYSKLFTYGLGYDPNKSKNIHGLLGSAGLSNAKDLAGLQNNFKSFYDQAGLDEPTLRANLKAMIRYGVITGAEYNKLNKSVTELYPPAVAK